MTLKEELEILRGEPIRMFEGALMDIPCNETSAPEKLCKNPVVSVHMITYNHESYIRQAIEGVMMQKTDFEFELVIGEDCSQDKTREICFEYQKQYPEKIRVLWWHENVSMLGGNGRRVFARCRGEFIAFCEGDDYWTDPYKLQKQVNVFRNCPSIGLCATGYKIYDQSTGMFRCCDRKPIRDNVVLGRCFLQWNILGRDGHGQIGAESLLATASCMYRVSFMKEANAQFDILKWRIRLGDIPLQLAVCSVSDFGYVSDVTSVYRLTNSGACHSAGAQMWVENLIVRFYFLFKVLNKDFCAMPWQRCADFAFHTYKARRQKSQHGVQFDDGKLFAQMVTSGMESMRIYHGWHSWPIRVGIKHGWYGAFWNMLCFCFVYGLNYRYVCDFMLRRVRRLRFVLGRALCQ
ncbi:MAG: glycosyltransferase family 2 protein [Bacteroidales bacterium]|nr:glycosyltransferase family 2 protein [Bacteroidales bacterium]